MLLTEEIRFAVDTQKSEWLERDKGIVRNKISEIDLRHKNIHIISGIILTIGQEENLINRGKDIRVMPVWKWLKNEL